MVVKKRKKEKQNNNKTKLKHKDRLLWIARPMAVSQIKKLKSPSCKQKLAVFFSLPRSDPKIDSILCSIYHPVTLLGSK